MNIFKITGTTQRIFSSWFHTIIGAINIKSIESGYREITINLKKGGAYKIKLYTDEEAAVVWTVDDFKYQANSNWEIYKNKKEYSHLKSWQDFYDEEEFSGALIDMINDHDANIGITWDTISFHLDESCRKEKNEN